MKLLHRIIIVTVFAIAMGLLESAVVIYLREIMYPEGFSFPLAPIHPHLAFTEILREMATLIMLLTVGFLAGKTISQRFAWFVFSFAIWDIFYYIFLWVLIGWPESLMTWDILFLIPITWTGPVLSPLLVTLVMILFSMVILVSSEKDAAVHIKIQEWSLMIIGSLIVVIAFTTDYVKHMLTRFSFVELFNVRDQELIDIAQQYIPDSFPWFIFLAGLLVILGAIGLMGYRLRGYLFPKRTDLN